MKTAFKMGARSWLYLLVLLVLFFLFISALLSAYAWIRYGLGGVLLLGALFMMYSDGAYRGERAATQAAPIARKIEVGPKLSDAELSARFDRGPAIGSICFGAALPLLFVGVAALLNLPAMNDMVTGWFVTGPIPEGAIVISAGELANVGLRLIFLPFMIVSEPLESALGLVGLYIAIIPMSFLLPAAGAVGYLMGPRLRVKKIQAIEKGAKRKRRNLKVHKKPRQPRQPKPEI